MIILVFTLGGKLEMLLLGTHLLPGDNSHILGDAMLAPLSLQRFNRRCRNHHQINFAMHLLQALSHPGERRHAVNHVLDGGIHGLGPQHSLLKLRVGMVSSILDHAFMAQWVP